LKWNYQFVTCLNNYVFPDFGISLNETSNQIANELDSLLTAGEEVNRIRQVIISRNFSSVEFQLEEYQESIEIVINQSRLFLSEAESLNQRSMDLSSNLTGIEELLLAARDRAVQVNEMGEIALNETRSSADLLLSIQVYGIHVIVCVCGHAIMVTVYEFSTWEPT